jgi:lysozyme
MKYSKTGLTLTEGFESCVLIAYWDKLGKCWTIGYGHTRGVKDGDICTREQALAWLISDVAFAEANVNQELANLITQGILTQNEFDALVDFDFNLGDNALDKSTLLKLVKIQDFKAAAKEFEKWEYAGGHKVSGLLRRRIAEENLFDQDISAQGSNNV